LKQSFQGEIVGNSLAWGGGVSVEEGCNCDPTCCMYPADELGGTYQTSDLPDAVTINWTNRFTGSISRAGSTYSSGSIILSIIDNKWTLRDTSDSENIITRTVGRCLIQGDGNLTPGDDAVEDQFADCYEISFRFFGGPNDDPPAPIERVTVLRRSLCVWATENFELGVPERSGEWWGTLSYRETNFFGDEISPSWIVDMDNEVYNPVTEEVEYAGGVNAEKYTLSTPLGTYSDGVTVTEC